MFILNKARMGLPGPMLLKCNPLVHSYSGGVDPARPILLDNFLDFNSISVLSEVSKTGHTTKH